MPGPLALFLNRKAASPAPPFTGGYGGMGGPLDAFGKNRAPSAQELVRENLGTAYSCAILNSDLVASTTLRLYVKTRKGEGKSRLSKRGDTRKLTDRQKIKLASKSTAMADASDVEEVTSHPLLDLLDNPTPNQDGVGVSRFGLFEFVQRYQEVVGRCYWYVEKDGIGGTPSAIWIMAPQYMREQPGSDDKIIDHYQFSGAMKTKDYAPDEIVPFRMPDLMNPYMGGMAPLRACFEQVKLARGADATTSAQLQNGGRPSAVFTPKGDSEGGGIGQAEAKRLQSALRQQFAMSGAGGIMVAEFPGTIEPLAWPINDIIDAARYGLTKIQIANAFQVPTTKLDRNDANRASATTGDYAHAKDAGMPRCKRNEAAINRFLIPMYGPEAAARLFVAYDDPPGLVDDAAEQAEFNSAVAGYSVLRNEQRARVGLPPMPWGDTPLAPSTTTAVDPTTGKPEPPPLAPAFGNLNIGQMPTADATEQPATEAPQTGQEIQTAQDTVLNGAQVTAATAIVIAVAAGDIPRDAGIGQLTVLFNLKPEQADQIMGSAGMSNVPTTPNPKPVQDNPNDQGNQEQAGQDPANQTADTIAGGAAADSTDKTVSGVRVQRYAKSSHDYSCVMAPIKGQAAIEMWDRAAVISEEDLADGGRESDLHVTVLYGLHTSKSDDVREKLKGTAPFEIELGVTKVFYASDFRPTSDCVVSTVSGPELYRLNELLKSLPFTNNYTTYEPHATLAYVKAGTGDKYAGMKLGVKATIDCLVFSDQSGTETRITLEATKRQVKGRIGNYAPNGLAGPLPQGEKIAHILRKMFQEQRAKINTMLAGKSKANEPATLPDKFVPLDSWTPEIVKEAKPIVELILNSAGTELLQRVGASPEVFAVFEKNIPKAAEELTLNFVESTNATTSMQLDEALGKLRTEITDGLIQGDTRVEMRKRVEAIFDQADQSRAETIARTEASRAQHNGEMMGAKESKVVRSKSWLASADACDICLGFVSQGEIPLTKAFGSSDYGPIEGAPAHPNCQCSLTYSVHDEPADQTET